jgi:glycosyltransferase involved in cell wall biosynthesis
VGGDVKFLAFSSACDPRYGSEPGVGWAWARLLAGIGETDVITRGSNRAAIEAALSSIPEADNLRFVYVDLPPATRWLDKHSRHVYGYLVWQFAALRRARELSKVRSYDYAWHLTWANAWLGSVAGLVGLPTVYGPVSAGVGTPWRLISAFGLRGALAECRRSLLRWAGRYINPLARISWRRADLILVNNPDTAWWFPRRHAHKTRLLPNAVLEELQMRTCSIDHDYSVALYAGRLLPWKGIALGLRAIAELPEWRLLICGSGPDEARLKRICARLGVTDRVEFLGWRPRPELLRMMREEADAFLFPSMHEEGGWVVAEALATGLPAVCLDRGGPPVLGGHAVGTGSLSTTVSGLASALETVRRQDAPAATQSFTLFHQRDRVRELLLSHSSTGPESR